MVPTLRSFGEELEASAHVGGGFPEHRFEVGFAEMVAAGGAQEQPAGPEELHGPQIDLLVGAEGLRKVMFFPGERRGIEHDQVEAFARLFKASQEVKGVGLQKADIRDPALAGVLFGLIEGAPRAVDGDDLVGVLADVQGEEAVIREDIEGALGFFPGREAFGVETVVSLVEEGPGLLPFVGERGVLDRPFV